MPLTTISNTYTCPHCEGTQRALNFFDPIELQLPGKFVVDMAERAPSGRKMLDWKCEECIDGKITVQGVVDFPEIE